ncbi:MAG: universal stress protein [Bacteroidia bacterium]|nr:universal stress protein [Bacteroidia bacterium]
MATKKKILFPTDFSEVSEFAVGTAVNFAKVADAELIFLHVVEPPTSPLKIFGGFKESEARKEATKMLEDYMKTHGDPELIMSTMVKIGKDYKKIVDAAEEISADYIIMGTQGLDGMKEYFVASNASLVIRYAPCPVLTIRQKPDHVGFNRILVPLDLTKETSEKVSMAVKLAEKFGSEVFVMTVLWSDGDEEVKDRLKKRMAKAVAHIKSNGIKVDSTMVVTKNNDITDTVMEYAKQIDADLISIMMQQEQSFKESLMGSHAARVVNHSLIPVMSIKPVKEYKTTTFSASHFG